MVVTLLHHELWNSVRDLHLLKKNRDELVKSARPVKVVVHKSNPRPKSRKLLAELRQEH